MKLIVAYQKKDRGIGTDDNTIPWHISEDLKYFKETTIGNNNNCVMIKLYIGNFFCSASKVFNYNKYEHNADEGRAAA